MNDVTLKQAKAEIANSVYAATWLFELLEVSQKIKGNGHLIRQRVSAFAAQLMQERWIEKDE